MATSGKRIEITVNDSLKSLKGTNYGDEIIFKEGAVQVTFKALKGNDKIKVNDGYYHKIYGDAGKDTVMLEKGNYITVYGGEGNDTITIGEKAGNQMVNFIYGGNGDDTVNIYGGGNSQNSGVYINGQWAYGGAGKDIITVFKGSSHSIYGNGGNDIIEIKVGNEHLVSGGSGKDFITINKGNKHTISGDGGNDTIVIKTGKNDLVAGGDGDDTITVHKGKGNEIFGGAGKDTISLEGGNASFIQGDAGDDIVTISGGASVSGNKPTSYHDPGLATGTGNDKVTIAADAGKVSKLYAGTGNDTITVRGGSGHEIHTGEGTDRITVTGGKNLKIYLDDGKNNITLSNANKTTVYTGTYSVDIVTIKWTKGKHNGNYQIVSPSLVSDIAPQYIDKLNVRGAKSTDFEYTFANGTLTMSNSDGSLSVDQLFISFDSQIAVKGGITFDDGTLSLADIGKKLM